MAKRSSKNGAGNEQPDQAWRSRIVGEAEVAPEQLQAHPENWREHPPAQQAALARVIGEVGWIQRVVVNQRTGHMLDGHCRVELAVQRNEPTVPVLYVDLSEEEERVVLATFDPISALATENKARLKGVLDQIKEGREELLQTLGAKAECYQHFSPCFSAKKDTLEQVIAASGVPLWEGYSRGFVRTACWCCPGQCGKQAAALQKNYPGLAEDIRRWEKRLGPVQPSSNQGHQTFDEILGAGERNLEREAKKRGQQPPDEQEAAIAAE